MRDRELDSDEFDTSGSPRPGLATGQADPGSIAEDPPKPEVLETVVSPFHCLYQDALEFHKQSQLRLARSEAESSRLARAALSLYVLAAEALVHQAAVELGRPDLAGLASDPTRPIPAMTAWRLLPAIARESGTVGPVDSEASPWPQLAELFALRDSWAYPGPESARRAYYLRNSPDSPNFEPMEPHRIPPGLDLRPDRLVYPRTGLPRDPYALRPRHLDTARGLLDVAIEALDRRLGGRLTEDGRHRREPIRLIRPV